MNFAGTCPDLLTLVPRAQGEEVRYFTTLQSTAGSFAKPNKVESGITFGTAINQR